MQWFDPDLIEQYLVPRAEARIPLLLAAMQSSAGARRFLKIEREERMAEVRETERGELEVEDAREPSTLEQVLAADATGVMIDHPYVQQGLRRRLRQAWHDLAVGGGGKVPSFMGLPDSFAGQVDWLPEGTIVCPDLPDLAPLADQVRREGWGSQGTTPKVKRRLATHVAPARPDDVNETNRQ